MKKIALTTSATQVFSSALLWAFIACSCSSDSNTTGPETNETEELSSSSAPSSSSKAKSSSSVKKAKSSSSKAKSSSSAEEAKSSSSKAKSSSSAEDAKSSSSKAKSSSSVEDAKSSSSKAKSSSSAEDARSSSSAPKSSSSVKVVPSSSSEAKSSSSVKVVPSSSSEANSSSSVKEVPSSSSAPKSSSSVKVVPSSSSEAKSSSSLAITVSSSSEELESSSSEKAKECKLQQYKSGEFQTWIGDECNYRINTGMDAGAQLSGYWFSYGDDGDGGKSKITWPVSLGNDESLDPVIKYCNGLCATAVLDKGSLTYKPFTGVGFNIAGEDSDSGDPQAADASAWGGICISYTVDTDAIIELGLGDTDATIGYANPAVSVPKATAGVTKKFNWSDFKHPSWYQGTTRFTGEEAAKKLVSIKFKIQAESGNYNFNIMSVGPLDGDCRPTD